MKTAIFRVGEDYLARIRKEAKASRRTIRAQFEMTLQAAFAAADAAAPVARKEK